ncbi:hypothetical protein ACJDU8_17130 [Clostridium sp. WILCCON 0269]|uniref:Uncharacterized protein n=1 Tax=Candidatus Clostridium eludens TaxID=3381663 RepID=A0ABW8SNM8_9CLOT
MGLAKYIINSDELIDDLKSLDLDQSIMDAITNKYPQLDAEQIQQLLQQIEDILPSHKYIQIALQIKQFISVIIKGDQKVKGEYIDVPAIKGLYSQFFVFDRDIYLTGIRINQTGWKKDDCYSLLIDKNTVIDHAVTKELGEHKYFNTYYRVSAGVPIYLNYHNNSGNSRQVTIELEYLQQPAPENIFVVMQWEKNTSCDMDLHGYIDNLHVSWENKQENDFYLDCDYTEHLDNDSPETLSVKGYEGKVLKIYINNYNSVALNEPVNVKVYDNTTLLKEYNIRVLPNGEFFGVCSIDLTTKIVTDMPGTL